MVKKQFINKKITNYKNKALTTSMLATLTISLVGCSSVFRNRDFDYSRENVSQRPELIVPKTISKSPTINQTLVLPEGKDKFTAESIDSAENIMVPPQYQQTFNIKELKSKQEKRIKTTLIFNKNDAGILTIERPIDNAWDIIAKVIPEIKDFQLKAENGDIHSFTLMANESKIKYQLILLTKEKHTQVSVFDDKHEIASGSDVYHLLEELQSKIDKGVTVSTTTEKNKQPKSPIRTSSNNIQSKIIFENDTKKGALIINDTIDNTWPLVGKALEKSGYIIVNSDSINTEKSQHKNSGGFYFIKDKLDNNLNYTYTIYVYPYQDNGNIFSDWSNWTNFFRTSSKQTRVAVFDKSGQLLPGTKMKLLLKQIQNNL